MKKENRINRTNKREKKHSQAYYDFFYAFWITVVIVGAVIIFMLSGFWVV